jgi:hypothetical protein
MFSFLSCFITEVRYGLNERIKKKNKDYQGHIMFLPRHVTVKLNYEEELIVTISLN